MKNYGGLPKKYSTKNGKIVILPVPFDGTSTWLKGADKGPEAIIEASLNMELYDIETETEPYKEGIYTAVPIIKDSVVTMVNEVELQVENYLKKDKKVIVLGGEHSVTIGSVRAYSKHYNDLTVLQLDAHSDMRDSYNGSKYNHASVMARVSELVPTIQVGIRSMDISEKDKIDPKTIFYAHKIYNGVDWIDDVIKLLTKNTYITIDLDVFDPSIIPSTGTPEPGGLYYYPVLNLIKKVAENSNIVGFDIVELLPNPDNKAPDFTASKLLYSILGYIYKMERKNGKK